MNEKTFELVVMVLAGGVLVNILSSYFDEGLRRAIGLIASIMVIAIGVFVYQGGEIPRFEFQPPSLVRNQGEPSGKGESGDNDMGESNGGGESAVTADNEESGDNDMGESNGGGEAAITADNRENVDNAPMETEFQWRSIGAVLLKIGAFVAFVLCSFVILFIIVGLFIEPVDLSGLPLFWFCAAILCLCVLLIYIAVRLFHFVF